jgi:hypothetical protein
VQDVVEAYADFQVHRRMARSDGRRGAKPHGAYNG